MDRKKLVNRMILTAIIVFIISGAVCIIESPFTRSLRDRSGREYNKKIAHLTDDYQKYLDKAAEKITGIPVNPHIISKIRSEIFKETPDTKLYLWMSDVQGEFIFGVPSPPFTRLNNAFDKYRNIIEKDGYYVGRNDFLLKLIHMHNKIRFSQLDVPGRRRTDDTDWRFYKERSYSSDYSSRHRLAFSSPVDRSRPIRLALSSPIVNKEKQIVGDLYLKVDHSPAKKSIFRNTASYLSTLFNVFHVICGFSGVFLWFLLPTWIYIDSRQRDVKNVNMWIILTLISFGFAFIIYLITRPPELKSFHCPKCEHELNGTKAFCPYCGFDLSSTFCPQCQYPVKPDWQFCPNCRFDMKQKPKDQIPEEKEEK